MMGAILIVSDERELMVESRLILPLVSRWRHVVELLLVSETGAEVDAAALQPSQHP